MARTIPITPAADGLSTSACAGSESFAQKALGDSMAPEFAHAEIVAIEPAGRIEDGSYVLAHTPVTIPGGGLSFNQYLIVAGRR